MQSGYTTGADRSLLRSPIKPKPARTTLEPGSGFMTLNNPLSNEAQKFERLVQKLAPQSKLLRIWPLKGGISAEMTAFEIEGAEGQRRKMIVRRPGEAPLKRNPQAAAEEFKLLQLAQALGLATQKPYYLDQSGEIFSTPAFVIEYIEGKPEFAPPNLTDFSLQLATQLARIHSLDGSNPDLSFL